MFLIPNEFWEIKTTKEKGLGVFTCQEIQKGTIIGDYLGKVIKTIEYDFKKDTKNLYLMYFSDTASIYPNLTKSGIHLINHSCSPNCFIYTYRGHTLFFAFKKIKKGEELTISYLLSPKGKCNPCWHICKCRNKNCIKTMHLPEDKYQRWQEFQKKQEKRTKKSRIIYGHDLPKLKSYPAILPSDPIYKVITDLIKNTT